MLELIIWAVLFVVLIVVEANTTQLIAIWFATGSLGAFVASVFDASITVQLIVFVVLSVGLLVFTRPLLKKFIVKTFVPTNEIDTIVGKQGVIIQKIDPISGTGRAKIAGLDWSAKSSNDEIIEENEVVVVTRLQGVTVWVEKSTDKKDT